MRYIRQKTITTTLFDGEVDDQGEIKKILVALGKLELDMILKIHGIPAHMTGRVLEVKDDSFLYKARGSFSGSLVKSSKFDEIEQIIVESNDEITVRTKREVNRWQCLSPSDFN